MSPPQSAMYDGQLETMFTYRGGPGGGGGGVGGPGDGMPPGGDYGVYPRHSPGAYGNNAPFNNQRGPPPQVYEFEYEEPRFT